ncbi:twin-arginine translocation signal domain-containing protein [Pedobacter sp. HMF7647]|uniref:Twin-arginine translocation signal domain-containing protein n=1 Tax=Hufsiella arboris TaxID=2695275 RepID=A0A7K1Y7Z3_9SPHI|nr:ferritin-like domain-containing protein [Hufsiella arboris]MXV50229.1 twin-arginine translocation signal domain-containing protein [Hufsiella arboris]
MENLTKAEEIVSHDNSDFLTANVQRRSFIKYAGAATAAVALIAAGCKKSHDGNNGAEAYLGRGDTGILNYAYALEQLEAAFYTQAVASFGGDSSWTVAEKALITDIRDHEIAHREFFKTALGTNAIGSLEVNFDSINFNSKANVLATAKAFEDLGVSAYNGAGYLIENGDYLTLAGKIVSVEARHAAYIRDLISNGSFAGADVVNPTTGLDTSRSPQEVLGIAGAYIKTKINANDLPS